MRAVRFHEYGAPEVLRVDEVDAPVAGPGQLLIKVAASGLNYADVLLRAGGLRKYEWYPQPVLPAVPGTEVAGTVLAVGAEVDPGLVGRRVVGGTAARGGGYAELAVADAAAVHEIPAGVDEVTAVALFVQGRVAVGVIRDAGLAEGDTVLVEAAGGGIGSLLVQLAVRAGARVIAAASSADKLALAQKLGAHALVDYGQPDWAEQARAAAGGSVDVVLETVGGTVTEQAFALLTPATGRMVLYGQASGDDHRIAASDLLGRGVTVRGFGPRMYDPAYAAELFDETFRLAATGALTPVIGATRPLAEAADAHAAFEARRATGKTVLVP